MKELKVDKLNIYQYETRSEMGKNAAFDVAKKIKELLLKQDSIAMIFAAAPSQNEFLAALTADKSVDFSRINAFHMDEYIGLSSDATQGFANFLKRDLFEKVQFKSASYLNGQTLNPDEECERYSKLLHNQPIDIVCMGIGENAHIAFNDPHVADFNDPKTVKVVELDEKCRNQQVHDGCFSQLEDVPKFAMTLTIKTLVSAKYIFCIVPASSKAQAVKNVVEKPVSEKYPASILRKCDHAKMYIDADSASLL